MKKALMVLVTVGALVGAQAFGAALTEAQSTPERSGDDMVVGVYTNTRIFAGALVCLNSSGYAIPAADGDGNIVIGRAASTVDNRVNATGAGDSGVLTIKVRRGVFGWAAADTVSDANIGDLAYVIDDNHVSATNAGTYAVIAGPIVDYDGTYVWVDTYHIGRTAGAFTTLSASGAASLSSTLGVTGAATFTGNAIANELDARTATALLLGKATATGVTLGAADAHTTVAGNLLATAVDAATATTMTLGAATATKVEIADTGVETEIQGTLDQQEAATFASTVRFVGAVTGTNAASQIGIVKQEVDGTTTVTLTLADCGKTMIVTNGAAVAITLPANGAAAGSWIDVAVGAMTGNGADDCAPTIAAATADTLITPNSADADSVTWGTGHRINAYARFWSDGAFWHVQNLGGTTMTYTDSD